MASESFYRYCLNTEFTRRRENNPQYSLRAFSRSLGFDASVISQVLAGKRVPSLKTAKRLAEALKLSTFEKERFFVSLAEVQKERGLRRMNPNLKTWPRSPAQ